MPDAVVPPNLPPNGNQSTPEVHVHASMCVQCCHPQMLTISDFSDLMADPLQTKAHVSQLPYGLDPCRKCNEPVEIVEFVTSAIADGYKTRECILIRCDNRRCRHRWLYCSTCNKTVDATNLKSHAKRHENAGDPSPVVAAEMRAQDPDEDTREERRVQPEVPAEMEIATELITETEAMSVSGFEEEQEEGAPFEAQEVSSDGMPRMRMEGNEWLEKAMSHQSRCTVNDLKGALSEPSLCRLQEFFLEELGSGEGKCGGGLCHMVARAFQQKNNERLDRERTPSFQEAKWHFDNLVLYQSMNHKQRKMQAELNQKLNGSSLSAFPAGSSNPHDSSLLKETFVPHPNQMGRYYGGNNQRHSMLELLPVPKAKDVKGVAYVGPTAVLKFAFANGVPVDDIVVMRPAEEEAATANGPVLHVEDSRRAQDWLNRVKRQYYGHHGKRDVEHEAAVGLVLMDWKDGFAYSFVKSNRGSVDVKTLNVSPPKTMTNEWVSS